MENKYFEIVKENNLYTSHKRLKYYLETILFKDVDFASKTMLDVGGGNGLFSYYGALKGAKKIVVMEPEMDGSTAGFGDEFNEMHTLFNKPDNIEFSGEFLQSYDNKGVKFDIVLMHNSINHLDEDACEALPDDQNARTKYINVLNDLVNICNENATIIVTDVSRYNFFEKINVTNPLVPTIEWQKHNDPEVWIELLSKAGFRKPIVRWLSLNAWGPLGNAVFGNKVLSYFFHSYFYLKMQLSK